jgi:hypothetical protein
MLQKKTLPAKYQVLTGMLINAREKAAAVLETEDGGTANFDALEIKLPRWREDYVKEAAERAGFSVFTHEYWGSKWFVFGCSTEGCQGNARTRHAEAMAKLLKDFGYEASVYYQMD